jgi:hypothetical protein
MLPVVRKRSFHVPHGLAALAAAVCLVLAFSAEDSRLQLAGDSDHTEPRSAMTAANEQHENQSSLNAHSRPSQSPTRPTPNVWIPWFPARSSAGG